MLSLILVYVCWQRWYHSWFPCPLTRIQKNHYRREWCHLVDLTGGLSFDTVVGAFVVEGFWFSRRPKRFVTFLAMVAGFIPWRRHCRRKRCSFRLPWHFLRRFSATIGGCCNDCSAVVSINDEQFSVRMNLSERENQCKSTKNPWIRKQIVCIRGNVWLFNIVVESTQLYFELVQTFQSCTDIGQTLFDEIDHGWS